MPASHAFKAKDVVTVYNQTGSGTFIIEGEAIVRQRIMRAHDRYLVSFRDRDGSWGRAYYERFVEPGLAQDDPGTFLAGLNAQPA